MTPARSIVLSGPMGVGKSTVARLLAERTGVPLVDVDFALEEEVGKPIARIFTDDGEAAFRAREAAIIARLLDQGTPLVLALGGGAVSHEATRRALVQRAIVVTLRASARTLVARIGDAGVAARPLLASEPDAAARLASIVRERHAAYAEAHAQLDTEGRTAEDVAREVEALWRRDPVAVPLGVRSYRVEVGHGVLSTLPEMLRSLAASKVLVVSDERIWPFVSGAIEPALPASSTRVLLSPGETHKTIGSIERIWDAASAAGLDRAGVVLAVGGGVVGDLAGFAAATWLRGVRFVQVPTTLLAMVDASVGGKTAIDRSQGKNLVGAFHQPSAVIADLDLLATLPLRDLRSGLAEVVKTALIGDEALMQRLESTTDLGTDAASLRAIVRASIAYKARVVAEDERDVSGARAALNFGHTVGHALEAHGGFDRWTHGEAVALGMIAALRVGVARGRTPAALLARATRLLERLGLPVELDPVELRAALSFVAQDKKREGTRVAYVLVPEVGRSEIEKLGLDELEGALLSK